jgi:hypothetical protein|tara:strand:+ start:504 stop:1121 length:618 start_codon:yes stop_codon:yes gene_type:complete
MKSTVHYGVFIEPKGSLFEAIQRAKQKVSSTIGNQVYLTHPPHCTLYHGPLAPIERWENDLAKAVGKEQAFKTFTIENFAFYDDPLANGGHTIAMKIEKDPLLMRLQMIVAETIRPFISDRIESRNSPLGNVEPIKESIERYNFPFVGVHWIPHFTISSLAIDKEHPLIAELLNDQKGFQVVVEEISIWKIDGDSHEKLLTAHLL